MSDRASITTWTGEIIPDPARLPDLDGLARAVRSLGEPFSMRGVEVMVDGELVQHDAGLAVKLPGIETPLALAPLTHKVQWDPRLKQEQAATEAEKTAHARLVEQWRGHSRLVRLVGPFVRTAPDGSPVLEVRKFLWRR